jgi:hypothetical protein
MGRKWTKASLIKALRAWHDEGKSMAELRRLQPGLIIAGQRRFGSWGAARKAAGLPPLRREWTPETLLEAIRDRHARGLPMAGADRTVRALQSAARKRFQNSPTALRAAGLQLKTRRSRNRHSVLAALRDRQAQGLPMTKVWEADQGLYMATVRHLGSWHAAMVELALPWTPPRKWSSEQVLEGLRGWYRLPKIGLRAYDGGLACTARTRFGSLSAALLAAGLEPRRRLWPRQRVLESIQAARAGPARQGRSQAGGRGGTEIRQLPPSLNSRRPPGHETPALSTLESTACA